MTKPIISKTNISRKARKQAMAVFNLPEDRVADEIVKSFNKSDFVRMTAAGAIYEDTDASIRYLLHSGSVVGVTSTATDAEPAEEVAENETVDADLHVKLEPLNLTTHALQRLEERFNIATTEEAYTFMNSAHSRSIYVGEADDGKLRYRSTADNIDYLVGPDPIANGSYNVVTLYPIVSDECSNETIKRIAAEIDRTYQWARELVQAEYERDMSALERSKAQSILEIQRCKIAAIDAEDVGQVVELRKQLQTHLDELSRIKQEIVSVRSRHRQSAKFIGYSIDEAGWALWDTEVDEIE